jgi:hypothetical protein
MGEGASRIVLVFDPRISAKERRRLVRKANAFVRNASASDDRPSEILGGRGGGVSFLFLVATFILHFVSEVGWWWVIGSAISTVAFIIAIGVMDFREFEFNKYERTLFVDPSELDDSCKALLNRAQRSIHTVLSSNVYAGGLLDVTVERTTFKWHEWDIATALRDITNLTDEMNSNRGHGTPGPKTAAVLQSHEIALKLARDSTTSRISALERFADQVTEADAAKRDWELALKMSGLNDKYRDLVARTAADKHAIEEITDMTDQAAVAAQVFRDSLHEASLAAEALVLPDRPRD